MKIRSGEQVETTAQSQNWSGIRPPTNPKEKFLETAIRKSPRKGSENHQKRKMGETPPSLEEPHRIFYAHQERFIQGLACLSIMHPSLKISP
jgi:hypothetical protein